jgi:hypothetical protein
MWLFSLLFRQLHWSMAVLKKFFSLVPIPTLVLVTLTLTSQFAKLLAFFLPLKVIILIGSTGVPRYFPPSWAAYDRDVLVIALSLATLLFYLLYMLAEKLLANTAQKGAAGVVERSRKLALFSNQDEVASQAYQKLAAGLATGVLALLLGLMFAFLYPAFFVVMVVYLVGVTGVFSLATQRRPLWRSKLQENASNLVSLLSGAGFLLLFAFMVADFLLWEGVSFMVAIISLLLSRQLLGRLEGVIKDAFWLHSKRLQVNAVFFTGHRLEKAPENPRHRKLWQLLSLRDQPERLLPLLERLIDSSFAAKSSIRCRWRQSGVPDILVFDLEVQEPGSELDRFLLNVFGSRHKKAALNEADLLMSETGRALPSPELMGVDQLEGFAVHLFRMPAAGFAEHEGGGKLTLDRLERCWQVEPTKGLIARYCRSHPLLHQRLTTGMLERLTAVAASHYQHHQVEQLASRFDELLAELNSLPLVVTNPGVPRELAFVSDSGDLQLAHWGNWGLEPIGADFPLGKRWDKELQPLISSAAERRNTLEGISHDIVRLCACCSAFEGAFNKQKYADAIALIPEILDCLPQPPALAKSEPEVLDSEMKDS